jgi:hypothetical protein
LLQSQFIDLASLTADFLEAQGLFTGRNRGSCDGELTLGGPQVEVGRDQIRRDAQTHRVPRETAFLEQRIGSFALARHTAPEIHLILQQSGDRKEVSRARIDLGG